MPADSESILRNLSSLVVKLDQTANTNTNYGQVYKATFSTRFWKKVGVRLTQEMTINKYSGSQSTSIFTNNQSGIRTSWKIVDGLEWITTYSLNKYRGKSTTIQSEYDMLDIVFRYRKKGSPWEFSVEGLNVLDTRSIRRDLFLTTL